MGSMYTQTYTIPTCIANKRRLWFYETFLFAAIYIVTIWLGNTTYKPLPDTHTQYYKYIITCLGPPFVFTFGETSQDRNKNLAIPVPAFPVPQSTRGCTLGTAACFLMLSIGQQFRAVGVGEAGAARASPLFAPD